MTAASMSAAAFALSAGLAAWLVAVAWPDLREAAAGRSRARPGPSGRGRRAWFLLQWRSPVAGSRGKHQGRARLKGKAMDVSAEALESVLVTVIAHLQAGRPLRQAWIEAAREVAAPVLEPAKGEFLTGMGAGMSLEEALALWYDRTGLRALRRCHAVAAAHRRTGGDVTGPTLAVIQGLREQRLAWAEVAARTTEAWLSARLLAALPVAVTAYAMVMDPAFLGPLWEEPLGRWGLGYAAVSWVVGLYLLRSLTGTLAGAGEG